jgi:hypothetical protein
MYKTVVFVSFMTALLLPGMAQVMPLPSMEDIRADPEKAHTDTGRADLMLNLALSYVYRPRPGSKRRRWLSICPSATSG